MASTPFKLIFIIGGLSLGLLLAVGPGLAQGPSTSSSAIPFVSGEILVKFHADIDPVAAQGQVLAQGLRPLEISPYSGLMRVQVLPGREAEAVADLSARPEVKFATLNYIITIAGTPNDTEFSQQWGLHNTGQTGGTVDADIDAPEAWDIHAGNSSTVVAIVDTGVDLDHEDLEANIWANTNEVPGNGLDDDGNGYIDDVNGWDFCNTLTTTCDAANDNDPDDENGHGTHVAGIAAASGNNGQGVAGVSWRARIMPVKAVDQFGSGTVSSIANGISYATANGARVINMSVAAPGTVYPCSGFAAIRDAMQEALAKNVLAFVSSGNQSAFSVACPAALDEAVAVGATNHIDNRWSSSNQGPRLDVAAPGANVYSTRHGGGYQFKTGTSMAAPHVAGLAALLWSFRAGLSYHDVRSVIEATTDDLGPVGHDLEFGHGRINARRALEALTALQTFPAQLNLFIDDTAVGPIFSQIQITSIASNPVTWQATISPTVSWLSLTPPTSGTVSTASAPVEVTLRAARPVTYGVYSTTVIFAGTNSSGISLGSRTTPVYLTYTDKSRIFLPLILKGPPRPDLVIEALAVNGNQVTVVIKNQGEVDVTDAFWVDVYFNPRTTPQINQPWHTIASHGLVWGVTVPIRANGGTLILTTGGPYYKPDHSSPGALPAGAMVYGLVDSYNPNTTYGNVLESNESNNLHGPTASVLDSAEGTVTKPTHESQPVSTETLPERK